MRSSISRPTARPSFGHLQDAISNERTDQLVFYAFDLLHLDGYDLTGAALEDRKAALAEPDPGSLRRRCCGTATTRSAAARNSFAMPAVMALEGIVSKRRDRPYRPGRSNDWIKVKCANRDEFVVIGFTDPAGQPAGLGRAACSAIMTSMERCIMPAASAPGLTTPNLVGVAGAAATRSNAPPPRSAALPKGASLKGVHWTEPALVAEVRYANWTADKLLRHATFLGLREDKSAAEVVRETDAPAPPVPSAPRQSR